MSKKNILILITTYKRPKTLARLVNQLVSVIKDYKGVNQYDIAISDSDRTASSLFDSTITYIHNKGEGFDCNLFYAFERFWQDYDFIFPMGDDDLLSPFANLFYIDGVLQVDAEAFVFDHCLFLQNVVPGDQEFVIGGRAYGDHSAEANRLDGGLVVKGKFYNTDSKTNFLNDPFRFIVNPIPSYCGIIYDTRLIGKCMELLPLFIGTLHLYVMPCLIAASCGSLAFLDYPLTFYHYEAKSDGAWENSSHVFMGLMNFARRMKGLVRDHEYEILLIAFYDLFFTKSELGFRADPNFIGFKNWQEYVEYVESSREDTEAFYKNLA
jgi:hypothetical protein